MTYDPDQPPEPQRWLALPLEARMDEVLAFHRRGSSPPRDPRAHALLHVAIEGSIATEDDARNHLRALIELGLDRHEAIHAIGVPLVLAQHLDPDASDSLRGAVPRWLLALAYSGHAIEDELAEVVAEDPDEAISWLMGIVAHEVDTPHLGMLAAHAATMLGRFEAPRAAPLLVKLLAASDPDDVLAEATMFALEAIGEPAVEPVLAQLEHGGPDDEHRFGWFQVLSRTGAQDERIFRALADAYHEEPPFYSGCLADYGDRRGLALIHHALAEFQLTGDPVDDHFILEHVHAIEALGGCLTAREQRLFAAYEDARLHEFPGATRTTPKKLGRNAPCWCGSGKKYKHCHWVEDAQS